MNKSPEKEKQFDLFKRPEIKIIKSSVEINKERIGSCLLDLDVNGKRFKATIIRRPDGELWLANSSKKFSYAAEQRIIDIAKDKFQNQILIDAQPKEPSQPPRVCPKCGKIHPAEDPCSDWA